MDATVNKKAWHALGAQEVLAALRCGPHGLSEEEAGERLREIGPNLLPAPPRRGPLRRFVAQFQNVLIHVLLAASAITALLGHYTDSAVILAVVLINTLIGFLQEGKAERAMEAVRHMLALHAAVLRDGIRSSIEAEWLVPGDIVLLEAGDKVPADLRLIETRGLQVDEAMLTGESVPVHKTVESVSATAGVGDRHCMAFSGTLVTKGTGRGVAVATGARTEIGRISGMLSGVQVLATPLLHQMDVFARWLTAVILSIAALLLAFGYFFGHLPFVDIFMAVVGLSVAAIPEGLPAVLSITLAVGVQAMARRNAIVRRLPAIETVGSVSVICTDKTGTLTRNEMMAASVAVHDAVYDIGGHGYAPVGPIHRDGETIVANGDARLSDLARAALLCNDAMLREQDGNWVIDGDPMEGALLALAGKVGLDVRRERAAWSRTDAIPFDAEYRFMATLDHDHQKHAVAYVKGAPERILEMCRYERDEAGHMREIERGRWQALAEHLAGRGERVLAFAVRAMPPARTVLEFEDVDDELVLVGLVGLLDPPRQEAIDAVAECRRAGIRVKMITGDHKGTAVAIARQVGLEHADHVLTGAELDAMDDARLRDVILETDTFARTSPEHKLRLVTALQAHGLTVAMTGDGVNDAPALKRADAGIAMGLKGSEAAKEAAELVLADDNFASIVAAIREGRTVYDNLRKVISWTMPTSAGEAMTIVIALLLGLTLPVTPIQILWVNLITAVTLGIALAFEPTEADTMRRPPRDRHAPLLGVELAWHIVLVSALILAGVFGMYLFAVERGYPVETARTIAVNTLVVMEIFHLFFIRNIYGTSLTWAAVRGTPVVWGTVLAVTVAQFAITYLPPLQAIFETRAVPLLDGVMIVGVGVLLFAIIEVEKQARLELRRRR